MASTTQPDQQSLVEVAEVLEELPDETKSLVMNLLVRRHQGPLPDPETFAAYEEVSPGAARSILDAADSNRVHRQKVELKLANTARLSLILTWIVVVGVLAIALVLALDGQPTLAGLFGVGGITPIILSLIRGGGHWSGK